LLRKHLMSQQRIFSDDYSMVNSINFVPKFHL
jgi:hypothetical protein